MSQLSVIDIRKYLMKEKPKATLMRVVAGNMYYKVFIIDRIYQFIISTVDTFDLNQFILSIALGNDDIDNPKDPIELENLPEVYTLSSDLGATDFFPEMEGKDLTRWIVKNYESGELLPVL